MDSKASAKVAAAVAGAASAVVVAMTGRSALSNRQMKCHLKTARLTMIANPLRPWSKPLKQMLQHP